MHCQQAIRVRGFPQLVCKVKQGSKSPETTEECIKCLCAHQYYCPRTMDWENTEQATKCNLK